MIEREWQTASNPHAMLDFLQSYGKPSERKLRLFAVAGSRRVWDWIDALGRRAVNVAERFADGVAGPDEMRAARLSCQGAGGQAAWYAAATNPAIAARNAARSAQAGAANNPLVGSETAELLAQALLVRDIFGNPFRPLSVDPSWLTLGVVKLAQTIYDDRCFEEMPAVAEALVEAGCDDADLLAHCRVPGPHVRGCWAVDVLLGKE